MSNDPICEGPLYIALAKYNKQVWEETYCVIEGNHFYSYQKIRDDFPANKPNASNNILLEFQIKIGECECKRAKLNLAELTSITQSSNLTEIPYYFTVNIKNGQRFMLGSATERDRARWIIYIKNLSKARTRPSGAWVNTGFLDMSNDAKNADATNRFTPLPSNNVDEDTSDFHNNLPSNRQGIKIEKPKQIERSQSANPALTRRRRTDDYTEIATDNNKNNNKDTDTPMPEIDNKNAEVVDDEDEEERVRKFLCCVRPTHIFGVKVDTIIRLLKVCSSFPFIIVVASLNLSNHYKFLRSVTGVRIMNILIYVAPVVYVRFVLSQTDSIAIQRLAIGAYILLYLFPVFYVVFSKVKASRSTHNIEDGTFCFRPARTVRWTMANLFALSGFGFEWLQHILYVLPLGIVTGDTQTKLSDFPPFLPFELYFWACIVSTVVAGLIIILNSVLQGKLHYRFQNSYIIWFFVYNVGSPMFVTFVTIFFMSLMCDFGVDPPVLVQQPSIVCYSERHIIIARAGLVGLAVYIIQNTLLPSGTFKETMRDNSLDILFVPVYLQAHFLLKSVFCGIYVFFYTDNFFRVISLTTINIVLLILNNFMKPCSVGWVNVLRDCIFIHATLSGIQSINYLLWPVNGSTKAMVISTLASNVLFSTIGMYIYYRYFTRSTEYTIATAFLDLEWQVSRGGSVHPRVLEPLISLTLSNEIEDWEIAKKYIGQLVWLISYPNMRVQFQSAWGLANLALLDEDARVRIHDAGGTKALFEWYTDMAPIVQLEVLAAMANLTLSMDVAEEMVMRNKCITFFIDLVVSNKLKHSQFAAIALSNLARKETFRELIRRSGGIPALVGCIMSHDYQKRRHGARALANMALSPQKEIEQVFESVGLINRIIKMTLRKEIETQREFVALIRNLACHGRLRPILLERNVMNAVEASQTSVFPEVVQWCTEITTLMEREIKADSGNLDALIRREGAKITATNETDIELLGTMEPLEGRVEWSTWGSKLESIFSAVFSTVPSITSSQVITTINCSTQVYLPVGLSKNQLSRYRDSLSYTIIERPAHGKLNEYVTCSDYVLYTPHEDYCGTDFFTYRIVIGSIETSPATAAITIGTTEEVEELMNGDGSATPAGTYWNSNIHSGFLAVAAAGVGGLTNAGASRSRKGSLVMNEGSNYRKGSRDAIAALTAQGEHKNCNDRSKESSPATIDRSGSGGDVEMGHFRSQSSPKNVSFDDVAHLRSTLSINNNNSMRVPSDSPSKANDSPEKKSKTTFRKQRSSTLLGNTIENSVSADDKVKSNELRTTSERDVAYSAHPFTDTLMKKMSVRRSGDKNIISTPSPPRAKHKDDGTPRISLTRPSTSEGRSRSENNPVTRPPARTPPRDQLSDSNDTDALNML